MDVQEASKIYQNIESEMAQLIVGSLQDDAAKLLGVDPVTLAGFTRRLSRLRENTLKLHKDIAEAGSAVRGPGDKPD